MASRPPLRGYNHNIRYRNRVYHVQTEDSGLENPRVFTHLYHGGVILGTARTEYTDVVAQEGHEKAVQKRMQEQHKSLMKALRHGDYDEQIVQLFGTLEGHGEDGATRFDDDEVAVPADAAARAAAEQAAEQAAERAAERAAAEGAITADQAAEAVDAATTAEQFAAAEEQAAAEQAAVKAAEQAAANQAAVEADEPDFEPATEELDAGAVFGLAATTEEQAPPTPTRTGPHRFSPDDDNGLPAVPMAGEYSDSPLQTADDHPAVEIGSELPMVDGFDQIPTADMTLRGDDLPEIVDDQDLRVGGAEPPPVPRRSMPLGSDLPPLPVEEIQAPSWISPELRDQLAEDIAVPAIDETTGRYQHALRAEGRRDASQPDLDFRLRVGAARRGGQTEEALEIPEILVERATDEGPLDGVIIDTPGPDDLTTSYSHVRRSRDSSPPTPPPTPPPLERRSSGVFERPLPKSAQVPSASQILGDEAPSARPRATATRPVAPRVHAVQGSTPQRYTAPSAQSKGRGRRATGSYEAVRSGTGTGMASARGAGSSIPNAPRRPGSSAHPPIAPRVALPAAPRMTSGAGPGRPRPPTSQRHPVPPPAVRPPVAPVVARPAVVVGHRVPIDVNPRKRSSSGVSIAAKGPPVPVAPPVRPKAPVAPPVTPPKRASQQTPRARPRNLPNLFGSDLISERSLDEVILGYLAEDGEKAE